MADLYLRTPDDGADARYSKMQVATIIIIPIIILAGLLLVAFGIRYTRSHRRTRLKDSWIWHILLCGRGQAADSNDRIRQMEEAAPPSTCYTTLPVRTPPRAMRLSDPPQLDISSLGIRELRQEATRRQSRLLGTDRNSRPSSFLNQFQAGRWSLFGLPQDEKETNPQSTSLRRVRESYRGRGPSPALAPGHFLRNPRLIIPPRRSSKNFAARPGQGFNWNVAPPAYRPPTGQGQRLAPSPISREAPGVDWPPRRPSPLHGSAGPPPAFQLPANPPIRSRFANNPNSSRQSLRVVSKSPKPGTAGSGRRDMSPTLQNYESFLQARDKMIRRIRGDRACSTFAGNVTRSSSIGRRVRESTPITIPAKVECTGEPRVDKPVPPLPERIRPRLSVEERMSISVQSAAEHPERIRDHASELESSETRDSSRRRGVMIQTNPVARAEGRLSDLAGVAGIHAVVAEGAGTLRQDPSRSSSIGVHLAPPSQGSVLINGVPRAESSAYSSAAGRESWMRVSASSGANSQFVTPPRSEHPSAVPAPLEVAERTLARDSWTTTTGSPDETRINDDDEDGVISSISTASPHEARALQFLPATRYVPHGADRDGGATPRTVYHFADPNFPASLGFVDIHSLAARSADLPDREDRLRVLEEMHLRADDSSRAAVRRSAGEEAAATIRRHIENSRKQIEPGEWVSPDAGNQQSPPVEGNFF